MYCLCMLTFSASVVLKPHSSHTYNLSLRSLNAYCNGRP
uniref:Secreted protein n=1 Tax=Schistosoma curassoni TaxID=6186 RepID=A0A183JPD2_9TREM